MDVEIQARGLELGTAARRQISQKVNQVTGHLPGVTKATVEEAAAQMQLLGHSFYMFLNRS